MYKIILFTAALTFVATSYAEETVSEKATAVTKSAKRSVKKGANRVKEAVCSEGDAKCLAKKAGHRLEEGADTVKDKTQEVKDKVD